ncbi:helix-turn-helix transcriptional regulator [Bifidobacterium longum]|uniref:helix-turn-helix transcriptional regulator n=1 Tax=Bifidobacterium longum TaxID=216816 RepID=UPI0039FC5C9F
MRIVGIGLHKAQFHASLLNSATNKCVICRFLNTHDSIIRDFHVSLTRFKIYRFSAFSVGECGNMNTDLLSPTEVSQWLRTPISTLARWRCEGTGPSYLTLGRRVLYRQQDIEKFLDASLHQTQCVGRA